MEEIDIIKCRKDKQKVKEYQKNYHESKKSTWYFHLYFFFHNIKNEARNDLQCRA